MLEMKPINLSTFSGSGQLEYETVIEDTPRTGDTTRGKQVVVNYIIKT